MGISFTFLGKGVGGVSEGQRKEDCRQAGKGCEEKPPSLRGGGGGVKVKGMTSSPLVHKMGGGMLMDHIVFLSFGGAFLFRNLDNIVAQAEIELTSGGGGGGDSGGGGGVVRFLCGGEVHFMALL